MKLGISALMVLVLCILYSVGIFAHLQPSLFNYMLDLTPWMLSFFAFIVIVQVLLSSQRTGRQKKSIVLWFGFCWIISYFLEVIGVTTGAIFGTYSYGVTLGPKLLGVPPIIGLNWSIIIFALAETVRMKRLSLLLGLVITAAGALVFDVFLEPLAMSRLGYWFWAEGRVAPQNYVAWIVIGFVFASVYFWLVPYPVPSTAVPPSQLRRLYRSCDRYFPGLAVLLQFLFVVVLGLLIA